MARWVTRPCAPSPPAVLPKSQEDAREVTARRRSGCLQIRRAAEWDRISADSSSPALETSYDEADSWGRVAATRVCLTYTPVIGSTFGVAVKWDDLIWNPGSVKHAFGNLERPTDQMGGHCLSDVPAAGEGRSAASSTGTCCSRRRSFSPRRRSFSPRRGSFSPGRRSFSPHCGRFSCRRRRPRRRVRARARG